MGEYSLSLDARSAKAREPLAQFPGCDVNEPLASAGPRQTGAARPADSLGDGHPHTPRWHRANFVQNWEK